MKVKDLIEILKNVDPELTVVLSRDAEGNGYNEWSGSYATDMVWDGDYGGEVGYTKLTKQLIEANYSEDDMIENGVPAFVMWPT